MRRTAAEKVRGLLDQGKGSQVRKLIQRMEAEEAAALINQLPNARKLEAYSLLPTSRASDVLLDLSPHSRKYILKRLKDNYIVSVVERTESDDSADILAEVEPEKAKSIFALLTPKKKKAILPLIRHDEDTAGGLMQSELIAIPVSLTVGKAIEEIRKKFRHIPSASYVYVVDSRGRLKGVLSITGLISAAKSQKLSRVMKKEVVRISPELDKEKVAAIFRQTDLFAVPVVDAGGVLLGRVTVDDVLDVLEEEATEDMFRIAGVHPDEHIFDPMGRSLRRRLPWLILNLGTAVAAAFVVSLFQDTIQAAVILAAFLPIVAGMGGNAGTQTLTIMVRSLALHELDRASYRRVIAKEMGLGLLNGLVTGSIMLLITYLWIHNIMIGIVILLAMIINLVVAGMVGTAVPLLLRWRKIDPAVASSIFITTFTDVIGFFSFLGIATLLLKLIV